MPRIPFGALAVALLFCGSASAEPSPLDGTWTGEWARGTDRLAVAFHFQQGPQGWSGSFDSDQLRVVGIPLRDIRVDGRSVEWKIVGDSTTTEFRGVLQGAKLAGTFDD